MNNGGGVDNRPAPCEGTEEVDEQLSAAYLGCQKCADKHRAPHWQFVVCDPSLSWLIFGSTLLD